MECLINIVKRKDGAIMGGQRSGEYQVVIRGGLRRSCASPDAALLLWEVKGAAKGVLCYKNV